MTSRLKKPLLVFIGLIVGFLCLEAGLRILGFSNAPFFEIDVDRGWAPLPGQQGWVRTEGGRVYVRINSDGLRDREHSKAKPPNTLRVAVLGDSYSEAAHVPMEETFWAVLGQELSSCRTLGGEQVEVINFGVDGFGTDQELLTLRKKVWDYSPDIVLLQFTPSNDVTDNSKALSIEKDKPFFIDRHGAMILDESFRDTTAFRVRQSWIAKAYYNLARHSRVLQLARLVRDRFRGKEMLETVQGDVQSGGSHLGLADVVYQGPRDARWEDAWRVTEGLVEMINAEVRAKGAGFLLVTVSRAIQVSPDSQARSKYIERLGVQDLFYPETRISALSERESFPVLTLAQPLRAYAEQHRVELHFGQGHWNREGNRLAGILIARKLCEGLASTMNHPGNGAQSAALHP